MTVVGGGLTGAAAAWHLARARPGIAITVLEPRAELGRGMAYTAEDPDHRLNGSPETHTLDPDDPGHVRRWIDANGVLARDPEALAANGNIFLRRHDYGRYVGDTVRELPGIRHVRENAVALEAEGATATVRTESGAAFAAALVVLATGNARPRLPPPLDPALASHPGIVEDAGDLERVRALPPDARVLLVGSGLTALDILSTLVRRGHRGPMTVVSRRGVRPRLHRLAAATAAPRLIDRIEGPVPAFVRAAGSPPRMRPLLHALRRRVREVEAAGGGWHAAFDEMRDVVWQFWPRVAPEEKRRFQESLRHWYDAHRFRAPPQNDAMVRAAEAEGRIAFRRARLHAVEAHGAALRVRLREAGVLRDEAFDALVNCTGLDPAAGAATSPLLAGLVARGLLTVDASGMGFAVDAHCRPLGRDGRSHERLRMFGPPTAGVFGDPLGVPFIAPQIRRALPGMLAALDRALVQCP